jgi:hypothetical protein
VSCIRLRERDFDFIIVLPSKIYIFLKDLLVLDLFKVYTMVKMLPMSPELPYTLLWDGF